MNLTRVTPAQLARSRTVVMNEEISDTNSADAHPTPRFASIDMAALSMNVVHRRNVTLNGAMWKLTNEVELGANSNLAGFVCTCLTRAACIRVSFATPGYQFLP
jgi:hypothetical protein